MQIDDISELRSKIDSIDNNILNLLAERLDCAVKIGRLKDELRKSSSTRKIGAYDPTRENEILQRLREHSLDLPSDGLEAIFREIMSLCRNAAHQTAVFYVAGFPELEQTALTLLGRSCKYFACKDEEDLVAKLLNNEFNIGFLTRKQTSEAIVKRLSISGFEIKTSFAISCNNFDGSLCEVNLITHS